MDILAQIAADDDGFLSNLDVNTWPGALVAIVAILALAGAVVAFFHFVWRG